MSTSMQDIDNINERQMTLTFNFESSFAKHNIIMQFNIKLVQEGKYQYDDYWLRRLVTTY